MRDEYRVYLVDDDAGFCDSITTLLSTAGINVTLFATAEQFIDAVHLDRPVCVLLDVRLPGMTGIDLLQRLRQHRPAPIVVMITGHGDVPMAVEVMRAGAFHFVEKPFDPEILVSIVEEALARLEKIVDAGARLREIADKYEALSAREKQVLHLLVEGKPSKLIAYDLGISTRTAEHHRSAVMKKMEARSLSHLVRMTLDLRPAEVVGTGLE